MAVVGVTLPHRPLPATLETPRLLLRPFTLDDAEAYWPLVSDPQVLRYTGEQPVTTLDGVRQLLKERPLRDYALYGYGRMACIEKTTQRLIGFCGLKHQDWLTGPDIGYRFVPDAWGRGYATESAAALMQHAVPLHRIPRVYGVVQPENLASAHVLRKLGLRFDASVCIEGEALDRYLRDYDHAD